jgi:UDPglucose 6-dehydrogenase
MQHAFDVHGCDRAGIVIPGTVHHAEVSELIDAVEFNPAVSGDFTGVYFVCLPTPMYQDDGGADLRIVEEVLRQLGEYPMSTVKEGPLKPTFEKRIAVVKSTIPPGTVKRWNALLDKTNVKVVFNPEFLTEANADDDFKNQNRIVLGGPRPWINTVRDVFREAFPGVPIVKTSSTTAEMVKYFTNVHLAARVVLSCELWQLCQALDDAGNDIDYDKVQEYAAYDKRLGGSHMSVPGQDGVPGARGHCFPKDLNALIYLARQLDVKPTVMSAVWQKNLELVPPEHRDWEKMKNRAVSKRNA